MKNLIYILSLLLIMGSCASIDKLVKKGKYDKAISLAVKKLKHKKNKKTKYVKGLETALKRINTRDMKHISNLIERDDPKYWDEIFETYRGIEDRQNSILPLLPLVSEDNYTAKFKFVKTSGLKKEAAENAAEYYYDKAQLLMPKVDKGNKNAAREAYRFLDRIEKYRSNYKNTGVLLDKTYEVGQTRILVRMENRSMSILPLRFERELYSFGVRNLDTRWYKFYTNPDGKSIDITATYKIDYVDVSPEKELVDRFVESKEVSDGWSYQYDSKGNVMKDTHGNDIKVQKYVTITANVINVIMEKSIGMDGYLEVIDHLDGRALMNKPLSAEAVFDEHFSTFTGDKEALSSSTRRRLANRQIYFPSDEELLMITADELKSEIQRSLRQLFK